MAQEQQTRRNDPAPKPTMHDPRTGKVDEFGAVFGLTGQDPDMDYAWCPVNRSGAYSVSHMRKAGYEVQRHGDLGYEFSDPLNPPKPGQPIVDDDLVLIARPKAKTKDVVENGFRGPGGVRVGGMQTRKQVEQTLREAKDPHYEGPRMIGPAGQYGQVVNDR